MQKNYWRRSLAEKVSFGISLSIVGIIVALVCYTWITGDNNPPILSVTTDSNIRQVNQQYYIPFTVNNYGGETAESVEIVANLLFKDRIAETGRQQIDFLSREEKRSGEFIFSHDPQQGELTIRVASYKLP
ncbi:TIGR02588 family protein [Pleurocapsa sp. PCC 7319]|uniref:TIGR02588 family protein n=1 Tax=Pleurocapsa sp. PCC 7319 TaxID=118161 RepID=UPI00034A0BB9|nr:TIGR02588 family protein [Pleurocapsa sp. PCC 7319]